MNHKEFVGLHQNVTPGECSSGYPGLWCSIFVLSVGLCVAKYWLKTQFNNVNFDCIAKTTHTNYFNEF